MSDHVNRLLATLAIVVIGISGIGSVHAFDQSDIDGATAGDTLTVTCAGSPHVQTADLNVDKTLTIVGETGCATPSGKPTIEFNDECHEVNVLADDVELDQIRFEKTTTLGCATQASDSYMVVLPSSYSTPHSIVPYGGLTVTDSIFVGSRRAMRISSTGDVTITGNDFSGNARDVIFVANLRDRSGTPPVFEFSGNTINGWGRKVVLVESGPDTDRVTGSIVVTDNVADGLTTSPNLFVYNNWHGSPAESATFPIDLTVTANEIRNLSSNAIVIYYPIDFAKFADLGYDADSMSVNFSGNEIYDAGRGIILDYTYLSPSGSIPTAGQVVVENNLLCRFSSSDLPVNIPVAGSGIASDLKAIGGKTPPPGLTTDAFGLSDGSYGTAAVSGANWGCDGPPAVPVSSTRSLVALGAGLLAALMLVAMLRRRRESAT